MYNENTIYVLGQSKTNSDNAITVQFNSFFIGFVICVDTDEIIDIGCSATVSTTDNFLKSILVGRKFTVEEFGKLEKEILLRYHGSSQKAIIVSCKEALRQYMQIKEKYHKTN